MRFSLLSRIGLALIMVTSLGGCRTTPPPICAAIGAGYGAIGGGIGGGLYAENNNDRDHEEWEGAGIAAASVLVGAGVGYLACNLMQEEPKPAPRQVTPAPPAEPAPAPPPPPPKPDPCTQLVRLEGVKFEYDKAELDPNAGAILDETIAALQRCPEKRVRLNAHTDSVGSERYNEALSQRRAESVRAYLASHGIAASRIEAHGLGESNPIADNSTPEGRAQNRRVELEPID